jgi:hypothetical protein
MEGGVPILVDGKIVGGIGVRAWTRRTMHKLLRLGPTLLGDRCD